MTTLSPTEARKNLTAILKRASKGEDVGILYGGGVVALRPVKVYSEDYAFSEYGVTKKDMLRFTKKIKREITAERKKGTLRNFTGNPKVDFAD